MSTNNDNTLICPNCDCATVRTVRCSNVGCAFVVTPCSSCDRAQAVTAFVEEHEKDCVHGPNVALALRSATFVAPRRAAA